MKSLTIWSCLLLAQSVSTYTNDVLQRGVNFTEIAHRINAGIVTDVSNDCFEQIRYLFNNNNEDLLKSEYNLVLEILNSIMCIYSGWRLEQISLPRGILWSI